MNTFRNRLQTLLSKVDDEQIKGSVSEILEAASKYNLTDEDVSRIALDKLAIYENSNGRVRSVLNSERRLRKLFDMGIHASADKILKESTISKFPNVSLKFEWFRTSSQSNPDYKLVESFMGLLNENKWDKIVDQELQNIKNISKDLSEDIMVKGTIDSVNSTSNRFIYEGIVTKLEDYLISKAPGTRKLIIEELSKYRFDTKLQSLSNNLKLLENNAGGFNLIENDIRCTISNIISPVKITESWDYFVINGNYFKKNGKTIKRINEDVAQKWAPEVVSMNRILTSQYCRVTPNSINFYLGKDVIRIDENKVISWNDQPCGGLNGLKTRIMSASLLMPSIRPILNNIIEIYENFDAIMEIDFAKNIVSNIQEGLQIAVIKGTKLIANKVNPALNENKVYEFDKVSGLKKFVMDVVSFDISESFTDILDQEQKTIVNLKKDFAAIKNSITEYESELERVQNSMKVNEALRRNSEVINLESSIIDNITIQKETLNKLDIRIKMLQEQLDGTPNPLSNAIPGSKIKMKLTGKEGTLLSVNEATNKMLVLLATGEQLECGVNEFSVVGSAIKYHDGIQKDKPGVYKAGSTDGKKKLNESQVKEQAKKLLETHRTHLSFDDRDHSDEVKTAASDVMVTKSMGKINMNPSMYVKHPDFGEVLDRDLEGFEANAESGKELEGDPEAIFSYGMNSPAEETPEQNAEESEPIGFGFDEYPDPDLGSPEATPSVIDTPIEVPAEISIGFSDDAEVTAEEPESNDIVEIEDPTVQTEQEPDGAEDPENTQPEDSENSEDPKKDEEPETDENDKEDTEEDKDKDEDKEDKEPKDEDKDEEDDEEKDDEDESIKEALDIYRFLYESDDDSEESDSIRPSGKSKMDLSFDIEDPDEETEKEDTKDSDKKLIKESEELKTKDEEDDKDGDKDDDTEDDELSGSYGGAIE